jgi:outer membrane immunogenic protein
MKKLWLGIVTLGALIASPAGAADMPLKAPPPPPAPAYNWSGVYFGLHGGYGRANVDIEHDIGVAAVNPRDSVSARGALYGAQLGLNVQLGYFVVGGELSLSKANINGSTANCAPVLFGPGVNTCQAQVDWLLLAMARLGVAPSDSWLLYGTAGWAVAGLTTNDVFPPPVTPNLFRTSAVHDGFAYGGGVEFRLPIMSGASTTLGLEYLRAKLDENTHNPSLLFPRQVSSDINIVRARLNIKLDWCCAGPVRY